MSELYMMATISDRNQTRRFLAFYREYGVNVTLLTYGEGTAASEVLDAFGLEAAEKARIENLRKSIVSSALQYVGNAYVYGGTDPHTGVDCSGFTRYILSHTAGIYLNRTAAAQSAQGRTVSADEAKPGDLVFYSSSGGHVDHVAIYMGDGKVVHASNERTGITTSNMYYRTPVRIANVLGD